MKPGTRKRTVLKLVDRRGGGTPGTNLWELLDAALRLEILRRVALRKENEPLLASFVDVDYWCLVAMDGFFFQNGQDVQSLSWDEIQQADLKDDEWTEVSRGRRGKEELRELVLRGRDDKEHLIRLESGRGFFLIWSVLVAFTLRREGGGQPCSV